MNFHYIFKIIRHLLIVNNWDCLIVDNVDIFELFHNNCFTSKLIRIGTVQIVIYVIKSNQIESSVPFRSNIM